MAFWLSRCRPDPAFSFRQILCRSLALIGLTMLWLPDVPAQDTPLRSPVSQPKPDRRGETAGFEKKISLADLPTAPTEIERLIREGRVTFYTGSRYAPSAAQARSTLDAETHYQIGYNYQSSTRWEINRRTNRLVVHVRFRNVRWQPTHRIWLRNPPKSDDFWTSELVLHEFDHVRISTDDRLRQRFETALRGRRVLVEPLDSLNVGQQNIDQKFVDKVVRRYVDEVIQQLYDLIDIRYQELDRITNHGRRPLPPDAPLRSAVPSLSIASGSAISPAAESTDQSRDDQ